MWASPESACPRARPGVVRFGGPRRRPPSHHPSGAVRPLCFPLATLRPRAHPQRRGWGQGRYGRSHTLHSPHRHTASGQAHTPGSAEPTHRAAVSSDADDRHATAHVRTCHRVPHVDAHVPPRTAHRQRPTQSDSKVRYITSLKRGDMGIRGKIH